MADKPYEPTIIVYDESGVSEFVIRDVPCIYDGHESDPVRAIRDAETRTIIGFVWFTGTPQPEMYYREETENVGTNP